MANLFTRIFGQSLSPTWSVSPGDIIWKLQVSAGGILVGETRDVEKKQLSLFGVRLVDGALLFKGVTLAEPWWIALEMLIGEVAIMHLYPRPDMPNVMGATAIDCVTGAVLWRNDTLRILCGIEEIALAQRGASHDSPELLLIDARTGDVLEELGDNLVRAGQFQNACADPLRWRGWIGSEPLDETHPHHARLMEIVGQTVRERRGPVEFAEYARYTVLSAHDRSRGSAEAMLAGQVDNVLIVLDGDRIVHRETITKNASGPSDDVFFIRNGQLIFIRDRQTLVSIDLNSD